MRPTRASRRDGWTSSSNLSSPSSTCWACFFVEAASRSRVKVILEFLLVGYSQNHLAVAGGYVVDALRDQRLRTHPLPRGGSDCIQATRTKLIRRSRSALHP